MRCPDCNKFVAYDEPQCEVQTVEVCDDEVRANITVSLNCADCSQTLKDCELEASCTITHECKPKKDRPADQKPSEDYDADEDQYEVENEGEPEGCSRMETKDRNGKPIKSARYMKTFYGFTLQTDIRCRKCGEIFTVDLDGEEQASSFNERV
jgi:hypothetical protein